MTRHPVEPYLIKVVEPIRLLPPAERAAKLRAAGFNPALLDADDVFLDLFTDSGTGGMSQRQWARIMEADESYAHSRSWSVFRDTIRRLYGFERIVPTHQGRGAENLLIQSMIRDGDHVAGNMYFPSTMAHLDRNGATFHDVIVDQAHDPHSEHPFKGDVDLDKLAGVLAEHDNDVAAVWIGATVNMAGGQPISMQNLEQVRDLARSAGVPVVMDGARAVENAYFIQTREIGWGGRSVAEILRAMCGCVDAAVVSAKKDSYANIGGWVGVRATHASDPPDMAKRLDDITEHLQDLVAVYEGHPTYGGMSGRDLEAVAAGAEESVLDHNIGARVEQVAYLGESLTEAGVPVVRPIGGHAVYLDAAAILPHIPREHFPAQTLVTALYLTAGIRGVERGGISAGRDPITGQNRPTSLELVRLAIPRRRLTQSHLDEIIRQVRALAEHPERITSGLEFTFEPRHLRFFRARYRPVTGESILRPLAAAHATTPRSGAHPSPPPQNTGAPRHPRRPAAVFSAPSTQTP